ncbi:MAG: hypothetical protein OSJ72_18755 [Lachnospiraceae bacterium]|nr:hypothetical protein [Lachnospiraceae bacterium]
MGFDFTIAIVPNNTSLEREMNYVKAALLYADKVTLISPLAYMFSRFTDKGNGINEKTAIKLLEQIIPLAKLNNASFYEESYPVIKEFSDIIYSKRYKSIPYVKKYEIQKQLRSFTIEICDRVLSLVGEQYGKELKTLIDEGQVKIEKFNHSLGDLDLCVKEYCGLLTRSIQSSYPIFDTQSNDLMKAAVDSRIIDLSSIDKQKINHAGLADNYIKKLPSFSEATMDEVIDIKKELSKPLIRFRSKMLEYSAAIQNMPWDTDFESECEILYNKEVVPALLEIEENTKDGSFIKNLGKKFLTDEGVWKSTGGLVVSVAAGGVISAFNNAISSDTAMLVTGGTYAATKIASAYEEHIANKRKINQKDMYFYYKAGKLLEK